jgi:MtfA peptidase
LMLAWSDVAVAGHTAAQAYNVVIHEFIHVMDVRDGLSDGCPPMSGLERQHWLTVLREEYAAFCEHVQGWQRFGRLHAATPDTSEPVAWSEPLLDVYGAHAIDEFFAVAAEAYFVQRDRFAQQHPRLLVLFDGFFRRMAQV